MPTALSMFRRIDISPEHGRFDKYEMPEELWRKFGQYEFWVPLYRPHDEEQVEGDASTLLVHAANIEEKKFEGPGVAISVNGQSILIDQDADTLFYFRCGERIGLCMKTANVKKD